MPSRRPVKSRAVRKTRPRSVHKARPRPARKPAGWWDQQRSRILAVWNRWRAQLEAQPEWLWLAAILLAAALLRFLRPDWYVDRQFHPDERWIFGVVSQLSYPQEPTGLQYGTFPMYVLAMIKDAVSTVAGWFGHFDSNRFVIWAGRMLSGFFDLGTIVFTFLLGRRLAPRGQGTWVGLLAAAFLSFTVLNVQMARFFVVDVPLGFLVAATLYWSVRLASEGGRKAYVLTGVFLGLAAATKTSAAPLAVSVILGHGFGLLQAPPAARRQRWQDLAWAVGAGALSFFLAMPHALLDWDKFWTNQNEQRRILVTGVADVPYNRQYLKTLPYIYFIKQLLMYTVGWTLGLAGLLAFAAYPAIGVVQSARLAFRRQWQALRALLLRHGSWWIVLGFALVYFGLIGVSFAKFNRYLLPLTPVFALLASHALLSLRQRLPTGWPKQAAAAIIGLALAGTVLWALAFTSIYRHEHPWIAASRWIQQELPAMVQENGLARPLAVLNEEWGDDLPTHVPGLTPKAFRMNKLAIQEPDTPRKREMILQALAANDLIVMADTRAHAVYRRLPERYPINAAYYELMFEGRLGFKLAAEFKNYPSLFGREFADDAADESFTLYDHPHVYLFRRQSPPLAPEEQARRLDERVVEIQRRVAEKVPARVQAPKPAAVKPAAGELPTVVNANIGEPQGRPVFVLGRLNGFTASLAWLLLVEFIGLLALPLCLSLFPRLPDSGLALAKIIGTLVFTWVVWMLVSAGLARHLQGTSALVLLLLAGASLLWAYHRRVEIREFLRLRGREWLVAEAVFLAVFVLYLLTKLYNPDIKNPYGQGYNGGGEPMGVTFLSAVYHSLHFPPYDPWLSGYSINYYYYGQMILGILAKLIGVPPQWSYQICLSLLFALTFTGVYGLGLALTGKRRWGLVAAGAAMLAGNLHTFFYLMEPFNRAWHVGDIFTNLGRTFGDALRHAGRFEFIWNPTRLIKGTINEMPWFSFLYGDLHAHIIAMPYSLPLIAWGMNLLSPSRERSLLLEAPGRTGTERGLAFFVTALTLGALSAINTWNFPPYALLCLGVLAAKTFQERKGRAARVFPWAELGEAGLAWLRLVVGGLALMFFFHWNFKPQSTSLAWVNPAVRTPLKEFLEFFGLVVFLAVTFWAQQLVPQAQRQLKQWGWASRSRLAWWERLQRVAATVWARHPLALYAALSGLVVLVVLLMFDQVLLAVLSLLLLAAVYSLGWQPLSPQLRLTMLLAVLGLAVVWGCELVHVRDFMGVGGDMSRMNTVFKFYMVVWIYFALVAASLLARLFPGTREEGKRWQELFGRGRWWRLLLLGLGVLALWAAANYFQETESWPWLAWVLAASLLGAPLAWALWPRPAWSRAVWAGVLAAVVLVAALYAPVSVYDRMRLCSAFKRPTLDGFAYLRNLLSSEAPALEWLRQNVDRTEVVLEAPGVRGYNCFDTRVAIFTGLPTLIGWVGQEEQMRYHPELTASHTRDADTIYSTLDVGQALKLMRRYRVKYVFVGENERRAYSGAGLEKFSRLLDLVYDQQGVRIYRVPGGQ
ncbi:MAG: DUF2298 domain-containing protein [candidate division FCPU426 bacterium]